MKRTNNKLKSFALFSIVILCLTSCKTDELNTFDSKRALYFPNLHPDDNTKIVDSVFISFSHHPGIDEMEVPFRVSLIGPILDENLEYTVTPIKERTSALAGDYSLPEKCIFRKGVAHDTLWVKIKKENLGDRDVVLALSITENNNFTLGYYKRLVARIAFNNIISQPQWWDNQITNVFFGVYSYKKYQTIIMAAKASGIEFSTVEGLTPSQIREVAIIAKEYIFTEGITEVNGDEMIIVAY